MGCKYLIFGNGFMGNKFYTFLDESIISDLRINDAKSVESEIKKHNPEIVINCVGKTGKPNIDWCEENKIQTLTSNVIVPVYIFEACQKMNKKMVHIGSGCIYEGDNEGKGFSEEDEPNFFGSFYSKTKIMAEKILNNFNVLQIRIRMPLDSSQSSRNLLTKILSYNKIISMDNSISIVDNALKISKELMDKNQVGVFNVVNKGHINHEEILKMFEKISKTNLNYEKISLEDLHKMTKAKRSNCVLSTKKLEDLNIEVPEITDALEKCISQYVANLNNLKNLQK